MGRLELELPELVHALERLPRARLRQLAVLACEEALARTSLDQPPIISAMHMLKLGDYGDTPVRAELGVLVSALDDAQLTIQERVEAGDESQDEYEAVFAQARAASALWYALDSDPLVAAQESMYEAGAALNEDFTRIRHLAETQLDG